MEDPRVARTRAAVLDAATELLVDGGPNAVTVDAIVTRSGVAKSTIYRHWESRDEILLAVFETCAPNPPTIDDTLPFDAALRTFVNDVVSRLSDPQWARMLPVMLMLKYHEGGIAALEHRLENSQRDIVAVALQRGVGEGVLRPGLDVEQATAHLVGPLLFAHLTGSVELTPEFADRTVDVFLAGYGSAADGQAVDGVGDAASLVQA
jgi:AcrR family transcriptional regulator